MALEQFLISNIINLVAFALSIIFLVLHRLRTLQGQRGAKKPTEPDLTRHSTEAATQLSKCLSFALPNNVVLFPESELFKKSISSYWAKQECEVIPSCVIRPANVDQLIKVVTILKSEYDQRRSQNNKTCEDIKAGGLFAIRSGGHSPVVRAASIEDGVLIDMSLFSEVTPSEDRSSVSIGTGAKWGKVFETLDGRNLAVAGGRNSDVGVGGLILGGGISFFSQRFGLVCSNIISYEIVLASGVVTTASASTNTDLWRALKGGGNNFGIVTRITVRSFPSADIWSGFLYMPSNQSDKVISAFHDFVDRASPNDPGVEYDHYASGPIACFTYLQQLGIQIISVNLVYTKSPEKPTKWPNCWGKSSFKSLWRFWSTCKMRSLANACDEMSMLNPPGRRQVFSTTTIKNELATLQAAHAAYNRSITLVKRASIKGLSWTLVFQPILPDWVHRGDQNVLGLQDTMLEPLIIISFTVNWVESQDDELVEKITRGAVEQIDAFARTHGTGHQYRYMNYCGGWQKPFEGYGKENLRFLRETSRKYDPEGLFQYGCAGGFKLDMADFQGFKTFT